MNDENYRAMREKLKRIYAPQRKYKPWMVENAELGGAYVFRDKYGGYHRAWCFDLPMASLVTIYLIDEGRFR